MPDIASATRPEEWPAVARLLASNLPAPIERETAAERLIGLFAAGRIDPTGIFVIRKGENGFRGAILSQVLHGALGLIWPPRLAFEGDPQSIEDVLVSAACDFLRGRGVKVCQAFGYASARADFAALSRNGFQHITRVVHLDRELLPSDTSSEPSRLILRPFAADPDGFATTLLATYQDSLDCTEMSGDRTQLELIEGFQGGTNSRWWFAILEEEQPVGVVMWEQSEPGSFEIAYLGLIPAARGRGLSHELVREAERFARVNGIRKITTTVDYRNNPARRLYARNGFRENDVKEVFLAFWPARRTIILTELRTEKKESENPSRL